MKRVSLVLILILLAFTNLEAQLTNSSDWQWYDTIRDMIVNKTTNLIYDFYKFVVLPQNQTMGMRVGETNYIYQNLHNVGSLSDYNGITMSIDTSTLPTGVTVDIYSNTNTSTAFTNTPQLNSGSNFEYYIGISVSTNCTNNDFDVVVTNRGSTNSGTKSHPAYYVVVTNHVHIISQNVSVYEVFDGVHYYIQGGVVVSDGIGNLNINVKINIVGDTPNNVYLYYDMASGSTIAVPTAQNPVPNNLDINRRVELVKEGNYWVGVIPATDPEVVPGNTVSFLVSVDGQLYGKDGKAISGIPTTNDVWHCEIKEYATQQPEGEHTISINNKFDPETETYHLIYKLDGRSHVNVSIYNVRGELVRQIENQEEDIGKYVVEWNGRNDDGELVAPGLYLVIIQTSEYGEIRKVLVIKR